VNRAFDILHKNGQGFTKTSVALELRTDGVGYGEGMSPSGIFFKFWGLEMHILVQSLALMYLMNIK